MSDTNNLTADGGLPDEPVAVAEFIVSEHARRLVHPACSRCRTPLTGATERLLGLCAYCDDNAWDENDEWECER